MKKIILIKKIKMFNIFDFKNNYVEKVKGTSYNHTAIFCPNIKMKGEKFSSEQQCLLPIIGT